MKNTNYRRETQCSRIPTIGERHSAAEYRAINKVISLKWNEGKEDVPPKNLASSRQQ